MCSRQTVTLSQEENSTGAGSAVEEFDIDKIAEESAIADDFDYEDIDDYYEEEEEQELKGTSNHLKSIFASSISSIGTTALCQPFETIKLELQTQPRATRNLLHCARLIYIEQGLKGFWRNHNIAQFVCLGQTVSLFWTFEQMRNLLNLLPVAQHSGLCDFMAGSASAGLVVLGVYPLTMIRIRATAKKRVKQQFGPFGLSHHRLEGRKLRHLYRGVVPDLIHSCPLHGCKFMLYNGFCEYMIVHTNIAARCDMGESTMLVAGAMSGMVAELLNHPLDLIKQRLQYSGLGRHRYKFDRTCRRFWQCAGILLQQRGVLGFYSGLLPNMLRSALNTSLQFAVFDKLRQWADDNM